MKQLDIMPLGSGFRPGDPRLIKPECHTTNRQKQKYQKEENSFTGGLFGGPSSFRRLRKRFYF
jgi:hypothetical protein